jgi:nucleoside 2-deoxyribosyltransferase
MHGCGFGIAVFERLEEESFNPNVSLEVGYMLALGKPVLILKYKTLKKIQTDLIGRLYKEFDPQNPKETIPEKVLRWLKDKRIVS